MAKRIPETRIAMCKRCRWPERIATGAEPVEGLVAHAKQQLGERAHVRASQCLNCCDGGHTVRIERRGVEIALVGIRTTVELDRVLQHLDEIAALDVPKTLHRRVYQVWTDGEMVHHRNIEGPWPPAVD